jgi:hypothetical protein
MNFSGPSANIIDTIIINISIKKDNIDKLALKLYIVCELTTHPRLSQDTDKK